MILIPSEALDWPRSLVSLFSSPHTVHVELAASSELQLTRAVLAVVPVLPVLGQVQLPGADVATPRARVSSRRFGHILI